MTDEAPKKRGRKPLDPSGAQAELFRFRLTATEKAMLEGAASKLGCSESEVARRALVVFVGLPESLQRGGK